MTDTLYIVLLFHCICTSNFVMLFIYSAFIAACFCKIQISSVLAGKLITVGKDSFTENNIIVGLSS